MIRHRRPSPEDRSPSDCKSKHNYAHSHAPRSVAQSGDYRELMAESTVYDALIIGGGPAGLSTSLPIIRQQFSAVIFDDGKSPIDSSKRLHLIPSWDGRDTSHFATAARDNLSRYETLRFECATVERVRKLEKYLFEVMDSKGQTWMGKKVVLANGVRYILPDIEGYAECWGKGMYVHDPVVEGTQLTRQDIAAASATHLKTAAPIQ
jgi:thioredoxin reductase